MNKNRRAAIEAVSARIKELAVRLEHAQLVGDEKKVHELSKRLERARRKLRQAMKKGKKS